MLGGINISDLTTPGAMLTSDPVNAPRQAVTKPAPKNAEQGISDIVSNAFAKLAETLLSTPQPKEKLKTD